jgi:hypothetical protein
MFAPMKRTSGGHGTRRSGGREREREQAREQERAAAEPRGADGVRDGAGGLRSGADGLSGGAGGLSGRADGLRGRHGAERPPGLDPRVRLAALVVAMAAAVLLPLAVAAAGPVGDGARETADRAAAPHRDAKEPAPSSSRSPHLLGLGLATATRCGPSLTSPDGVEAQTCVLTQGAETWARTYYRNTTGHALTSALSLLKPGGGAVRIDCAIGAEDEPGTCETPRQRTDGEPGGYEAVAEFAREAEDAAADGAALLLRAGSGSARS